MNNCLQKPMELTNTDKLRILLKNRSKLVLVQQHELERIQSSNRRREKHNEYVEYLYQHYIVDKKQKTYLN